MFRMEQFRNKDMIRHRRHFSTDDEQELLQRLREARTACTSAMGKAPVNGPVYIALTQVTEAIDEVCAATGRKYEYFWLKSHSATSHAKGG
jgi:hypothetical protein